MKSKHSCKLSADRRIFFLLLLFLLWNISEAAVQVKTISTNYAAKTVTFSVSWAAGTRDATHLSKVWVFVDYQEVTNPNTTGSWQRANIDLSKLPANSSADGANTKGFWYQGQATAAQSATITVALTNVPTKFNWCAYATDYPPNVTATGGTYALHGTAPFTLIAADGVSTQVVNGTTIATSALTVAPVTIRDATGCPGVFCIYTGADLYIDAIHSCRQRTSGAQNWEAWIKDARDNEYYRIVLMPDNKWWLAQNVKLASYNGTTVGSATPGCTADECGRVYTYIEVNNSWGGTSGLGANVQGVCPKDWVLPVNNDWNNFVASIGNGNATTVAERLRSLDADCSPITNWYGWASLVRTFNNKKNTGREIFYRNEGAGSWLRFYGFGIDQYQCGSRCSLPSCNEILYSISGDTNDALDHLNNVRCLRVLKE